MTKNNSHTRRNERRTTALKSIVRRQITWADHVLNHTEATDEHGALVDAQVKLERAQSDEANTVARMKHVS